METVAHPTDRQIVAPVRRYVHQTAGDADGRLPSS